jgi:Zn-dependent peptidase ImmA (M78 family)
VTLSPYALLASRADVQLIWTENPDTLRGARGRWFPDSRVIAIDSRVRRLISRCSLAHELGHVVLEHPTPCGNDFFDRRVEEEADEFAARLLLDDLDELARELATTCHHGHAAANLRVTLDMLETRLKTLTDLERRHISKRVWAVHDSTGA